MQDSGSRVQGSGIQGKGEGEAGKRNRHDLSLSTAHHSVAVVCTANAVRSVLCGKSQFRNISTPVGYVGATFRAACTLRP
jgi:hypothetical protein